MSGLVRSPAARRAAGLAIRAARSVRARLLWQPAPPKLAQQRQQGAVVQLPPGQVREGASGLLREEPLGQFRRQFEHGGAPGAYLLRTNQASVQGNLDCRERSGNGAARFGSSGSLLKRFLLYIRNLGLAV